MNLENLKSLSSLNARFGQCFFIAQYEIEPLLSKFLNTPIKIVNYDHTVLGITFETDEIELELKDKYNTLGSYRLLLKILSDWLDIEVRSAHFNSDDNTPYLWIVY